MSTMSMVDMAERIMVAATGIEKLPVSQELIDAVRFLCQDFLEFTMVSKKSKKFMEAAPLGRFPTATAAVAWVLAVSDQGKSGQRFMIVKRMITRLQQMAAGKACPGKIFKSIEQAVAYTYLTEAMAGARS